MGVLLYVTNKKYPVKSDTSLKRLKAKLCYCCLGFKENWNNSNDYKLGQRWPTKISKQVTVYNDKKKKI